MAQETASNTFALGMTTDINDLNMASDTMTTALNATLSTFNGNEGILQNDMGNCKIINNYDSGKEIAHLPAGYVPIGSVEFGGVIYYTLVSKLTFEKGGKIVRNCQIGSFPSPDYSQSKGKLIYQYLPLKVGYVEEGVSTLPIMTVLYNGEGVTAETTTIGTFSSLKFSQTATLFNKPTEAENPDNTIYQGYLYKKFKLSDDLSIVVKAMNAESEGSFGGYFTYELALKMEADNGDGYVWRLPKDESEVSKILGLLQENMNYSYSSTRKGMRYLTPNAEFMYVPYGGFLQIDVSSTTSEQAGQTSGGNSLENATQILTQTDSEVDGTSTSGITYSSSNPTLLGAITTPPTALDTVSYIYYTNVSMSLDENGTVTLSYTENNSTGLEGTLSWTANGSTIEPDEEYEMSDGDSVQFIVTYTSNSSGNTNTLTKSFSYSAETGGTEAGTTTTINNTTNNNTTVENNNLSSATSNVVTPETTGEYSENVNSTLTTVTLKYVNIGNFLDSFVGENCYIWARDAYMYRWSDHHKLKLATEKEGDFSKKEGKEGDPYCETYTNSELQIIPVVTIDIATAASTSTSSTSRTPSNTYEVKVALTTGGTYTYKSKLLNKAAAESAKLDLITDYKANPTKSTYKNFKTTVLTVTSSYDIEKYKAMVFLVIDTGADAISSSSGGCSGGDSDDENSDDENSLVTLSAKSRSSCCCGKTTGGNIRAIISDSSIATFEDGTTDYKGAADDLVIVGVSLGTCTLTVILDGETTITTLAITKAEEVEEEDSEEDTEETEETTEETTEKTEDSTDDTSYNTNYIKFTTLLSSVDLCIEDDIDTDENRTLLFGTSMSPSIQYSYDGNTWTNWDGTSLIKFGKSSPLYLRGLNPNGFATGALSFTRLHLSSSGSNSLWTSDEWSLYNETNGVKCSGDLMSLINYKQTTTTIPKNAFTELFFKEHSLITVPNCSGSNFSDGCFMKTFAQTSITKTPTLTSSGSIELYSLSGTFQNCKGLTTISGINFNGTVASCGCEGTFLNCYALETVNESLLSSITWAGTGAFMCMFDHCTSLKKAPIIPDMTYRDTAFDDMFRNCTSLVYLKVLVDSSIGVTREFYELHDLYDTETTYSYGENGVLVIADDNTNTIVLPDTWTKQTVSEESTSSSTTQTLVTTLNYSDLFAMKTWKCISDPLYNTPEEYGVYTMYIPTFGLFLYNGGDYEMDEVTLIPNEYISWFIMDKTCSGDYFKDYPGYVCTSSGTLTLKWELDSKYYSVKAAEGALPVNYNYVTFDMTANGNIESYSKSSNFISKMDITKYQGTKYFIFPPTFNQYDAYTLEFYGSPGTYITKAFMSAYPELTKIDKMGYGYFFGEELESDKIPLYTSIVENEDSLLLLYDEDMVSWIGEEDGEFWYYFGTTYDVETACTKILTEDQGEGALCINVCYKACLGEGASDMIAGMHDHMFFPQRVNHKKATEIYYVYKGEKLNDYNIPVTYSLYKNDKISTYYRCRLDKDIIARMWATSSYTYQYDSSYILIRPTIISPNTLTIGGEVLPISSTVCYSTDDMDNFAASWDLRHEIRMANFYFYKATGSNSVYCNDDSTLFEFLPNSSMYVNTDNVNIRGEIDDTECTVSFRAGSFSGYTGSTTIRCSCSDSSIDMTTIMGGDILEGTGNYYVDHPTGGVPLKNLLSWNTNTPGCIFNFASCIDDIPSGTEFYMEIYNCTWTPYKINCTLNSLLVKVVFRKK